MTEYIDKTAARRAALAPCEKCVAESDKCPVCDGCKLYGVAQEIDRIPAVDFCEGFYLIRGGVLYKITPKIAFPYSKSINVMTGEVHYQTNADKIRGMSDEELAEYLFGEWVFDSKSIALKWLQKEEEDD